MCVALVGMEYNDALTFPDAPRGELDRVLSELVSVAGDVQATQGRLRALLRANQAITQQLELPLVLRKIVEVAVELVGAEYGALGVVDAHGGLEQFVHVGMSKEDADRIGRFPEGHGLLGALIDDPRPIRLLDLSTDPRSSGFPAGHPAMDTFLGVPVRVRNEVYGNLYLSNRRVGEFTADDEELMTALAATAGFAIDNARLYAETKRRQAWSAASAEITAAFVSDEDNDAAVLIASAVLTLAEADLVRIALPSDDPTRLIISVARGIDEDVDEGRSFPIVGSLVETVLESRQPRLIGEPEATAIAGSDTHLVGPTMAVPMLAHGDVLGVLMVSRLPGAFPFTATDMEMAADFAGRATVAMALSDGRAARQRMALLEDRGRIARDLHDHVIQQLFGTGLELQSVLGTMPPGPAAERIDRAISEIDKAIAQIRIAIFTLSSSKNKADTLRHRVIDVVNEAGASLLETPRLEFSGPVDIAVSGTLADDVVAVVRESLTNVVKHATANTVSVSVVVAEGAVVVTTIDDGVGLSVSGRRSGLANLGARAGARGGSFDIGTIAGKTNAVWSAPYGAIGSER
jgi:signal transduction histidine kinase